MNWQPIETAPKDARYIWLAKPGSMRLGFWRMGEQYEHHGSVGGGWADLARVEAMGPSDLQFEPTHWLPIPQPPAPVTESEFEGLLNGEPGTTLFRRGHSGVSVILPSATPPQ